MINLTLPIYHYNGQKQELIGLNRYERMHHQPRNKMKQWFYSVVRSQLPQGLIKGQYKAHFKLYYRNKKSDAPNIIAAVEKMAIDGLQQYNALEEDSVMYYTGATWEVVEQDKDNPRVEVQIVEAKAS